MARYGVPRYYRDWRAMIDEERPDVVDIITPPETHEDRNFAGDCVYYVQRHFVDCMFSGAEFESNGRDYLKTIEVVEAACASAATSETVRLPFIAR